MRWDALRAEWESRYNEWQASGLSRRDFCKERALNYKAFMRWQARFLKERPVKIDKRRGPRRSHFVKVEAPVPKPASEGGASVLLPDGIRIEIQPGADLKLVTALMTALRGGRA